MKNLGLRFEMACDWIRIQIATIGVLIARKRLNKHPKENSFYLYPHSAEEAKMLQKEARRRKRMK